MQKLQLNIAAAKFLQLTAIKLQKLQLKIAAAKFLQLTAIKLQKLQLKIAAAKFLQLIAINWSVSLIWRMRGRKTLNQDTLKEMRCF